MSVSHTTYRYIILSQQKLSPIPIPITDNESMNVHKMEQVCRTNNRFSIRFYLNFMMVAYQRAFWSIWSQVIRWNEQSNPIFDVNLHCASDLIRFSYLE